MAMIGTGGNAFHPNVQPPRRTDTHGAADSTERDALTSSVVHHGAWLIRNAAVFGHGHQLACARLTLMSLLTRGGMAIVLVPA
jgi:hypothetical protein